MTTLRVHFGADVALWFAQNSLPLWLKWQLQLAHCHHRRRCDLLKIHYLCGWNDNNIRHIKGCTYVVICSKFITFVVEMTTRNITESVIITLWFAQNSLPLWLKWQLSILYPNCWLVVICSKFITFVVEMTTSSKGQLERVPLWFAQNSLPLWLKWQLIVKFISWLMGCDLLKIHYLCGWNDNNKNRITN